MLYYSAGILECGLEPVVHVARSLRAHHQLLHRPRHPDYRRERLAGRATMRLGPAHRYVKHRLFEI